MPGWMGTHSIRPPTSTLILVHKVMNLSGNMTKALGKTLPYTQLRRALHRWWRISDDPLTARNSVGNARGPATLYGGQQTLSMLVQRVDTVMDRPHQGKAGEVPAKFSLQERKQYKP